MTITEAIAHFFRRMTDAYLSDQVKKGIYSSGRSAQSLRTVTRPDGGDLSGKRYWHQQKVGRRPGKFPPVEAIMQWIQDKGIQSDIPEKSLAFLIGRKIARSGTDIFQRKRPGIDVEKELTEARKELALNIGRIKKDELIAKLKQTVKQ